MAFNEEKWLVALQEGIPLMPQPFEFLSRELNCSEGDLIDFIGRLRKDNLVRRFGAVFDTRRLGYKSCLCAAYVPLEFIDEAASCITPLAAVTHCYLREIPHTAGAVPNLWFTLSTPEDIFGAMCTAVAGKLKPYNVAFLPASRRYKVDVLFGAATRARDEAVESSLPVTAVDRKIIAALQGDTEVSANYFTSIAESAGLKEWDLLSMLEMWRRNGRLKRIGLLLRHREAGYVANGMCCWNVEGDTTQYGRALAQCGEVSHCYERPEAPGFPYNLFAMIHTKSPGEAQEVFERIAAKAGLENGVMLISTKEYKKTSMTFFSNHG